MARSGVAGKRQTMVGVAVEEVMAALKGHGTLISPQMAPVIQLILLSLEEGKDGTDTNLGQMEDVNALKILRSTEKEETGILAVDLESFSFPRRSRTYTIS
jgi:hypothetical protein